MNPWTRASTAEAGETREDNSQRVTGDPQSGPGILTTNLNFPWTGFNISNYLVGSRTISGLFLASLGPHLPQR